jgi:serine/threonine-protein kinase
MTLYRLLHGEVWYEEAPRPQTMIEDGGFVDTLKWLPHIPKPWRTFIRRTMNDAPAKRFQNTTQVLAGIAALPVEPQWEVEVAPQLIKWHRTKGQRRIKVEWERISSRKHQWRAWSEPIASGRSMSLDGSGGVVGQGKAIAGLKAFFGA